MPRSNENCILYSGDRASGHDGPRWLPTVDEVDKAMLQGSGARRDADAVIVVGSRHHTGRLTHTHAGWRFNQ